MYHHDDFDAAFVAERNRQFRAQVARRLSGALTEEEFKPLRLMNGVYLQLHAYMLRVAIPYGTLNARQMRQLARVAERWDRGYGHFTTRQNVQFNWPRLVDIPDMLDALAEVGMHAIQTSGNTIRNVTTDHFAGAAADEIEDPRPTAELIRQWSTDHPEFQFLGRKFKIAVSGSTTDRAVLRAHDLAVQIVRGPDGQVGYRLWVGGGLGRTPLLAEELVGFIPRAELLPWLEAVLSTYNSFGRRDNKYKARIKILVREMGLEAFREAVLARLPAIRDSFTGIDRHRFEAIRAAFAPPVWLDLDDDAFTRARAADPAFRAWVDTNVSAHRQPGYAIATVSLKAPGQPPGDASAEQMRVIAAIAEELAHDELRISHEQNVVLPHVPRAHLPEVHARLKAAGLATANLGLVSDIIACPGLDYCALATARSIPVAQQIATRFAALKLEHDIGPLKIRISGCINACGHHHVGHIGILGLDRAGVENYQITLGGETGAEGEAAIGQRLGPGFPADQIVPAIERLLLAYLELRDSPGETFAAALRRLGPGPFKAAVHDGANGRETA